MTFPDNETLAAAVKFLRAILPSGGPYCCFVLDGKRHVWADKIEELAENIFSQDAAGLTVYHANASFKSRANREQANVAALKALWLDIDVGAGKPYPDQESALAALSGFCDAIGAPRPWVISSGGGGLHVYWPLDHDISPKEWLPYARGLKALCPRHGLEVDNSATTDSARVLRTPGTHHRKDTANVREVIVISEGETVAAERLSFLREVELPPTGGHDEGGCRKRIGARAVAGMEDDFPAWSERTEKDLDNLLDHIDGEDRANWHDVLSIFTSWAIVAPDLQEHLREKFESWSARWPDKVNEERNAYQWTDGVKRARERRANGEALLGFGTLVMLAGGRVACPSPAIDALPLIAPCADVDPTKFRWTDAWMGPLFVALFGENVRYVEAWRRWTVWDGKRWVEKSDAAMLPLARAATEHMFAWAAKLSDSEQQGKLRTFALATQKQARLNAMLELAKGEASIRVEPSRFDADPMLLGCPNGTMDLRTGQFREARREDYITKCVAVDFDPNATCPNFLKFLEWAQGGDKDTIEHLQRVAGYFLTGDVSEEKLFAFFGPGANGKTTLAATELELLGSYAGKARKDLLLSTQGEKGAASPDVAALHGKRLVLISETDDGCTLAEAQVKEITSNEPICARRLHKDPFEFMPTHKCLLPTNHRPFVKGTDDGIWRRLDCIPFSATLPPEDKDMWFRERVLHPELPGILKWAVEGCLKWQNDRKQRREGLKPSTKVKRAVADYRQEMDFVGQWINEHCEPAEGQLLPGQVAFRKYRLWAEDEGYPGLGRRKFGNEMDARGFPSTMRNGERGYIGLRLKSEASAGVSKRASTD